MSGRDWDYDGSIATASDPRQMIKKSPVPAQQFRTTGRLLRSSVFNSKVIEGQGGCFGLFSSETTCYSSQGFRCPEFQNFKRYVTHPINFAAPLKCRTIFFTLATLTTPNRIQFTRALPSLTVLLHHFHTNRDKTHKRKATAFKSVSNHQSNLQRTNYEQ
jgi:hypothetical protein